MGTQVTISPALRQLLENLKGPQFEKNIPYMYLDSEGKITVGVGHNIDAHHDLLRLPFRVKRFLRHHVIGGDEGTPITTNKVIDRSASNPEKQNDYDFLKKHKGLHKYAPDNHDHKLRKYTTLELAPPDIENLFAADLNHAITVARGEFGPAFDSYPVTCQAALVDIAFNVGSFASFQSHMVPAIKGTGVYAKKTLAESWKIASQFSARGKASSARNAILPSGFWTAPRQRINSRRDLADAGRPAQNSVGNV